MKPVIAVFTLLLATRLLAQTPSELAPIAMPVARAAESYQLYSRLVPLGETGGGDWPHDLWLIRATTIAIVPANKPCWVPPGARSGQNFDSSLNPHTAVQPMPDRQQDYNEILADFDLHCHERLTLDPAAFHVLGTLRLLNEAQQKEFQSTRFGPPNPDRAALAAKYKGAPALYGFSEVYFNAHHTVALVYATHWCGGLCGQGFWLAFGLQNGQWKDLGWHTVSWIS